MWPRFVAGLDLGQSQDFSALAILAHAGPGGRGPQHWHVRHLQRWPLQTPYPAIVRDVVAMLGQPPLAGRETVLAVDMTGVGRPVVDLFRAELRKPAMGWAGQRVAPAPGLAARLVPVTITGGNRVTQAGGNYGVPKRDLAAVVQVALQMGRLKVAAELPDTPVLMAELQNFRVKISVAGHDSYGAGEAAEWREGKNDDLVLAVAVGLWTAQRGRGATLQAV